MATKLTDFDVRPEDTLPLEGFTSPVNLIESVDAAMKLSGDSTTLNSLIKIGEMRSIESRNEDKPKLSVEELRTKYPQFASSFTFPMSEEGADYVVKNKLERNRLAQMVDEGPKGALASSIRFAAGFFPHAVDPVNWVTGMGATALATKLATGARAARIAAIAKIGESEFATSVAEGVAGNLLTEPITAFATKKEQEDYTAGQFFFNTVGGAIMMSSLGYLGRKIFSGHTEAVGAVAHDVALRQVSNDRFPEPKSVIEQWAGETNPGKVRSEKLPVPTDYKFAPFTSGEQKSFFMPSTVGGEKIDTDVTQVIGKSYGGGVYLSDNVVVANNRAASAFSNRVGDGTVREIDISKAKLYSLDQPISAELKNAVLEIPEIKKAIDFNEVTTAKDLFDKVHRAELDDVIRPGVLRDVQDIIKSQGYDGLHYTMDKDHIDRPHDPHNVAILFDDSKMVQKQFFSADSSLVPVPAIDRLRGTFVEEQAPGRQLHYNPQDEARVQGIYNMAETKSGSIDEGMKSVDESIEALKSQGEINNMPPEARAEYDALVKAKSDMQQEMDAWKALEECIRGG